MADVCWGLDRRGEALLMTWNPQVRCAPHGHDRSSGVMYVLRGKLTERRFRFADGHLEPGAQATMDEHAAVEFPAGRIHDMVARGLQLRDLPALAASKVRAWNTRRRHPDFADKLDQLVADPAWERMLEHNPIRSQHEFQWYLDSRFADGAVEVLNVGWNSRVLGFDSGPIHRGWVPPQSYP